MIVITKNEGKYVLLGGVGELAEYDGVDVDDEEDDGEAGGAPPVLRLPHTGVRPVLHLAEQSGEGVEDQGGERSHHERDDENETDGDKAVDIVQPLSHLTLRAGLDLGGHHLLAHHPVTQRHDPDEGHQAAVQGLHACPRLDWPKDDYD